MGKLSGKVAFVTGAASGIGRSIARIFAAEGARVVAADIADEEIIGREAGPGVLAVRCDVRSPEDVSAAFQRCLDEYGPLDILCNNAGIAIGGSRLHEVSLTDFDAVMDTNVRGAFIVLQHGLSAMLERGGSIVNTASIGAFKPAARTGSYCLSKAAVLQMTRIAALEYAPNNIRVNALCPGTTRTAILDGASDEVLSSVGQKVPLGRLATADEIANGALYLASDDSSFVTGITLVIDGGKTIG